MPGMKPSLVLFVAGSLALAGSVDAAPPDADSLRLVRSMGLARMQLLATQIYLGAFELSENRRPDPREADCLKATKPEGYEPILAAWVRQRFTAGEIRDTLEFAESQAGKKYVNNLFANAARESNRLRDGKQLLAVPPVSFIHVSRAEAAVIEKFESSSTGKRLIEGVEPGTPSFNALEDEMKRVARQCIPPDLVPR